jgi:hypothetical protein
MSDEVKEEQNTTSIVLMPNIKGTVEAMHEFQRLKREVLDTNDTVMISGKLFIKRSGVRKIEMAFGITHEIVSVKREKVGDVWIVEVVARARTPLGRVSEDVAVCDSTEFLTGKLKGTLHNIESKATTRAINRAVLDLVGGGEVSAEEVTQGPEVEITEAKETQTQKEPPEKLTQKQFNYLQMLMKDEQVERFVEKKLNGRKLSEITKSEASDIIDEITEM